MQLNTKEILAIINAYDPTSGRYQCGNAYQMGYTLKKKFLAEIVAYGYDMECRVLATVIKSAAKHELARTFGSEYLATEFLERIYDTSGPSEMAEVILTLMSYGHSRITAEYDNGMTAPF